MEALEAFLNTQPVHATRTTQPHRCGIYYFNLNGHYMVYRLLQCSSPACAKAGGCTAWIKTLTCVSSVLSSAFSHGSHADVDQTNPRRMTLAMKRFTKTNASNGAKPLKILSEMIEKLKLNAVAVPRLGQVQRVVYYHKKKTLLETALVTQMEETARSLWYRVELDESTPFTFSCPTDSFGVPFVGNGSNEHPFLIGVTTKRLVRGLARAAEFPLHVDATYKVNQQAYPMVVCGVSDACRSIHVAAVFISSHLRQEQFTTIFSSIFDVYQLVTGEALKVKHVAGDADDAQFNGFEEVMARNCSSATYLMCLFHVMLNVKKRVRKMSEPACRLVYKHVCRIHHARDEASCAAAVTAAQVAWGTNNPLEQFNKAFKRDYTQRQVLPVNGLMEKVKLLCKTKSTVLIEFKSANAVTPDLPRRLKYLNRAGLISHTRIQRTSMSWLLSGSALETEILVKQHGIDKPGFLLSKTDETRRHALFVEVFGQPREGWRVDIATRRCPCGWWFKFGSCVHLVEAMAIADVTMDSDQSHLRVFVSRRKNKRPRAEENDYDEEEDGAVSVGGRPAEIGPASAFV